MNMQKLLHVLIVSLCLVPWPKARAVIPPPDGAYPNSTTAEGQNALFGLTTGVANTGLGWLSLRTVSTGSYNTAVGAATSSPITQTKTLLPAWRHW